MSSLAPLCGHTAFKGYRIRYIEEMNKLVKVNHAKTRNNSHYPGRANNSVTMTRDAVVAFNIVLITISSLLSATAEPIFPFSCSSSKNIKYTRHSADNIVNTDMTPSGNYCSFYRCCMFSYLI